MKNPKSLTAKFGLTLGIVGLLMLPARVAFAQQEACVSLLVGAGYAAWMRVVSGEYASTWSDLFNIGQTRCKSLDAIGDGQPFTVQLSALLGSSQVPCQPDNIPHVSSSTSSVTFQAWGTTLNIKCHMPSSEGPAGAILKHPE